MSDQFTVVARAALAVAAAAVEPTEFQPARMFVSPGDPAWDDCCSGQLWVRPVFIRPHQPSKTRAAVTPMCGVSGWTVRLGVGHVHCVHTVTEQGYPPTVQQVDSDGELILGTAEAIKTGFMCTDALYRWRPMLVSWEPLGPSGGCAGGEWLLDLDLMP